MALPTNHDWPVSLHAAHAVEEFALMLDGWRAQFNGQIPRDWSRVPSVQKALYRDLVTRLLHRLGPPVIGCNEDERLRRADLAIARSFEVIK